MVQTNNNNNNNNNNNGMNRLLVTEICEGKTLMCMGE